MKNTKTADSSEATLATWKESRPARTPAEHDTFGAMGTGAWLDPVDYPDQEHTLTFHERRAEVYITASGQELPAVAVHEIAELACLGLRDINESYPDFPYNEYVVVDTAGKDGPSIVWEDNFRTNTTCSTSVQNRGTSGESRGSEWRPTDSGLEQAQIPSTDKTEIRVAEESVNSIISEWQGNSRTSNAPEWLDHGNMSVGFAPDEAAMYVWANKPEWDQPTRDRWADIAADVACQAVLAEAHSSKEWRYIQYAIAIDADDSSADFLRWGSAGTCAS